MFYLITATCVFVFVFWNEGKREGFDKYKLLDIVFTLIALSVLLFVAFERWFINLSVYHYSSIFLKFDRVLFSAFAIYLLWIAGLWGYSRSWKWSIFRLLDIFSLSQIFFMLILVTGGAISDRSLNYFFYLVPYLVAYKVALSVPNRSGVDFALITGLHAVVLAFIYRLAGRLPIELFLLTIAVLTIYFRRKISMNKTSFTTEFLDFIKIRLYKKDKELQRTETLLKSEDPYLQPGRAEGNAESMDEAILEDALKDITDTRLSLIKKTRLQVKRALAFLKIGNYGLCEICGKPIDKARLTVYPEATRCIEHSDR